LGYRKPKGKDDNRQKEIRGGLPLGEVRKLWAPDALQRKETEIARAETLWKAEYLDACKRIVEANCRNQAISLIEGVLSVIEICTKPLARRTLPRVRGSAVVEGLR
jgi:hypothetical protein